MLRAEQIDPRDQTREFNEPAYRVLFWSSPDESRTDLVWTSDEWELSGADIDEALAWVRLHGDGHRASLWVVVGRGPDVAHIRWARNRPDRD